MCIRDRVNPPYIVLKKEKLSKYIEKKNDNTNHAAVVSYTHLDVYKRQVVLDIIPEAVNYVTSQVEAMGATVKKRDEHLLEVYYDTLPELEEIDKNLKMITGVIETSLFYQVATKALVAGEEGIRVIK